MLFSPGFKRYNLYCVFRSELGNLVDSLLLTHQHYVKMNIVNNNDTGQTNWPKRKPKELKQSVQIPVVKGLEHINHENKLIPERAGSG